MVSLHHMASKGAPARAADQPESMHVYLLLKPTAIAYSHSGLHGVLQACFSPFASESTKTCIKRGDWEHICIVSQAGSAPSRLVI